MLAAGALAAIAGCANDQSADQNETEKEDWDDREPTEKLRYFARGYGVEAGSSEKTNMGLDIFIRSNDGHYETIADVTGVAIAFADLEYDGSLAVLIEGSEIMRFTIEGSWAAEYREGEITLGEYMSKVFETAVPANALERTTDNEVNTAE